MKEIAVMLPTYNQEKEIITAMENVEKSTKLFPEFNFTLYAVNDGSTDRTLERLIHWRENTDIPHIVKTSKKNMGVAQVLRENLPGLADVSDYILKTDTDLDFNHDTVFKTLIPYAFLEKDLVAGVRCVKIDNPYENERRLDTKRVLKEYMGFGELDPPSAGSFLCKSSYMKELFKDPNVKYHEKRWGFEFAMYLTSFENNKKPEVKHMYDGSYTLERRPKEKIDAQHDRYLEIIEKMIGVRAEHMSNYYKGGEK